MDAVSPAQGGMAPFDALISALACNSGDSWQSGARLHRLRKCCRAPAQSSGTAISLRLILMHGLSIKHLPS
ncbi:hypothetical protein SKAU_G00256300 [Synaphobranchus kaupii]|uniref:Uncharacterized protein n=1 Tax=Synaphobranchus kaupii TaxID=118154 RepID=A0A9Q1F457_SYNKA|nr:hypothetical protein SKAU_G00256300 [Synaphobranchus kaupii]